VWARCEASPPDPAVEALARGGNKFLWGKREGGRRKAGRALGALIPNSGGTARATPHRRTSPPTCREADEPCPFPHGLDSRRRPLRAVSRTSIQNADFEALVLLCQLRCETFIAGSAKTVRSRANTRSSPEAALAQQCRAAGANAGPRVRFPGGTFERASTRATSA